MNDLAWLLLGTGFFAACQAMIWLLDRLKRNG